MTTHERPRDGSQSDSGSASWARTDSRWDEGVFLACCTDAQKTCTLMSRLDGPEDPVSLSLMYICRPRRFLLQQMSGGVL